jgi:hypothetical protein
MIVTVTAIIVNADREAFDEIADLCADAFERAPKSSSPNVIYIQGMWKGFRIN